MRKETTKDGDEDDAKTQFGVWLSSAVVEDMVE